MCLDHSFENSASHSHLDKQPTKKDKLSLLFACRRYVDSQHHCGDGVASIILYSLSSGTQSHDIANSKPLR
jgi:hypothetical protein